MTGALPADRLAESIKKHRLHQAFNGRSPSGTEEDDMDLADPEEAALRSELAETTRNFKSAVRQLKDLKAEIEHRKHLIESMNIRLVQAFQKWWAEQEKEQMLARADQQAWQTPPRTPASRGTSGAPLPEIPPSRGLSSAGSEKSPFGGLSLPSGTHVEASVTSSFSGELTPQQSFPGGAAMALPPAPSSRRSSGLGPPAVGGNVSTGDPTLDAAISSFFSDRRRAKGEKVWKTKSSQR